MEIIKGDLIDAARKGEVNVIAHGCNCFNTQGAGIAKQMNSVFNTLSFPMEQIGCGDRSKLGKIDYRLFRVSPISVVPGNYTYKFGRIETRELKHPLWVVNMYTQYNYSTSKVQLDYNALENCLDKLNTTFMKQTVGLPYKIGCGLAGGNWNVVERLIKNTLTNVEVKLYKL